MRDHLPRAVCVGPWLPYAHLMQSLSTRASWWMTAACFAWVWGLLSVAWPPRYAWCIGLAAAVGAATWVATRWPWPGVALTAAGLVALGVMGIGTEDPAPLGPLFIVLVTVGYLAATPWSVLAVPILAAATAIPAQWDLASIMFGGLVVFLPWWFGVRVRVRDAHRQVAAQDAQRLAGLDPAALARQAAAIEGEEVAASAFAVIGRAVGQMTKTAVAARERLDTEGIDTIHRKGEEATQRLRALLVLLRDDPPVGAVNPSGGESSGGLPRDAGAPPGLSVPSAASVPREAGGQGADTSWGRTLLRGWPAGLILLDVLASPYVMALLERRDPDLPEVEFVLVVVLPLMVAVLLRERLPVLAPLMAATTLILGTSLGVAHLGRDGLWLMITVVALSWAAGEIGSRRSLVAWFIFTMTVGYLVFYDTPYYLPIYLAMSALPFGAAAVWSGHHDAETAHLSQSQVRQREIEVAQRAAIARERLQLARDLHDAASHAVGTMMMQANAARVLRERDPEGARAALDAIIDIGQEASAELRDIRSPGVEPAQSSSSAPEQPGLRSDGEVAEAIAPLVTAARRSGLRVTTALDLRAEPGPQDVVLLLRVVREGLANVTRHAPGSEVTVEVSVLPPRVLVVVANGPGRVDPGQDGPVRTPLGLGLGLRGLRELVDERDGDLSASGNAAGFELRASFPPQRVVQGIAQAMGQGVVQP